MRSLFATKRTWLRYSAANDIIGRKHLKPTLLCARKSLRSEWVLHIVDYDNDDDVDGPTRWVCCKMFTFEWALRSDMRKLIIICHMCAPGQILCTNHIAGVPQYMKSVLVRSAAAAAPNASTLSWVFLQAGGRELDGRGRIL